MWSWSSREEQPDSLPLNVEIGHTDSNLRFVVISLFKDCSPASPLSTGARTATIGAREATSQHQPPPCFPTAVDSDTKVLCSHSSRFARRRPRQNSESPSNLDDVRDLNRLLATSGGRDMPFGSFGLIRPAAAHVMESIHFFA